MSLAAASSSCPNPTRPKRLTLSDGERTIQAVWKTIDEYAPLKDFHDEFLSWGAAPVPFVRRRMLPGADGPIL